jgi:hypothetical protein
MEEIVETEEILNDFGKHLINNVRDETIECMEMIISGKMKSEEAQLLYKKTIELNNEIKNIINEIIINTIDRNIARLLDLFEQTGKYIIAYDNGDEKININEISDGLSGELYGKNGWIKKYSKYK